MGFDLFSEEQKVLEKAEQRLTDEGSVSPEQFGDVLTAYRKLLKTTKKLVRISDRNEDKLNTLSKELADKNTQLQAQARELIQAAELREEVERITRHDLKNPLQNILSVPELLLMTLELEDYQRDMLKRVEESGYAMLNMINLSLDLFKMETGTYHLQAVKVDLLKVVRKVLRDQESIWQTKEMPVSVTLDGAEAQPDDRLMIQGEELLCYSMLSNLVRNALDASPDKKPLTVALTTGPKTLTIHNMGAVPEDIRDTFFDKYATSGKERGTGLGTYSAKLITEVHGGTIGYTTSETDGTAVTLTFPG